MFKKIKSKVQKLLIPVSIILFDVNVALATDEITRKMNNGKKWLIGIVTGLATINVAWAVYQAGNAKSQSEIESAEKQRKNSIWALIGILVLDVAIALYKSW